MEDSITGLCLAQTGQDVLVGDSEGPERGMRVPTRTDYLFFLRYVLAGTPTSLVNGHRAHHDIIFYPSVVLRFFDVNPRLPPWTSNKHRIETEAKAHHLVRGDV